ncbi:MAG: hypothetical protein ACHBN1_14835 [Heteroscytonema crispum UTEX LB 1556]
MKSGQTGVHTAIGEKICRQARYSCPIPVLKSFALLLPGRATPVAKAAGKPFQQVLQVGEACTAVAHGEPLPCMVPPLVARSVETTAVPSSRRSMHGSRSWGASAVDGFPGIKHLAWKPRQFLQVGEAAQRTASPRPRQITNGLPPQDRAKSPTDCLPKTAPNHQRTASPTHWLNFSLYKWGNFILHTSSFINPQNTKYNNRSI